MTTPATGKRQRQKCSQAVVTGWFNRSMRGDEIIGQWSVDAGYHSATEDEQFVFWNDGVGLVEYARPGTSACVLFRWTRTAIRMLRLEPYRCIRHDGGAVVDGDVPEAVETRYRITREQRPLIGEVLPVLYLPAPFATIPDRGYGLITREPAVHFTNMRRANS
ncbi:hypothetical protein [Nocardia sp. NPDC056100]|uniref:hypothetical protein n=1 Tax=Nocardia sp. NPDC056100 TaxID=3345712 RepID=UPI0035D80A9F